jgi:hypothetical protein
LEEDSGFHPARGCIARLKEHQEKIDTDFREVRAQFAQEFPPVPDWNLPAPSKAHLNAVLNDIIQHAPARLRELKQQLADCLCWELNKYGQHICAGVEVSEITIRALYAEI